MNSIPSVSLESDIDIFKRAISVARVFGCFPRIPVSLYHQATICIIRSNIDIDIESDLGTKILPSEIRKELKEWKSIFPWTLFIKNSQSFGIPLFFRLAVRVIESAKDKQLKEINGASLSDFYDTANIGRNNLLRSLRRVSKQDFVRYLGLAIKYISVIPLIKKLKFRVRVSGADSLLALKTLRKACQTGSYPLVLYWTNIILLNLRTINRLKYQNLVLQEVLIAYFKSDTGDQLKLICQLLDVAYGLDIIKKQMIVAAKQDNLKMLESICFQRGNSISPLTKNDFWGTKHVSLAACKNVFEQGEDITFENTNSGGYSGINDITLSNHVGSEACCAGSLSVIKHIIPTSPNTWKHNAADAIGVAESGKMPALEYFLQRKHVVAPMIHGAITTANIGSFGFLLLVMAKEPSKIKGLAGTFANSIAKSFNPYKINLNYYIILRYLTIIKLNLRMKVESELKAAAILRDAQLIECIKFRTRSWTKLLSRSDEVFSERKDFEDFEELDKKIGFNLGQSWVDQFNSVDTIRRASFEMLLESVHYTKIGITRLIQARENGSPLIDLKWALKRSIEMGNVEIEKAILQELNPPPIILTKSTHPRKRSISSIKAEGKKTTPNGQPKKKKIKLPL